MKNGKMKICVCGRFHTGKKSLINILLGKRILQTPMTPVYYADFLELSYGAIPEVIVTFNNKKNEPVRKDFDLFETEFNNKEYNQNEENRIYELKMKVPVDSLKGIDFLMVKLSEWNYIFDTDEHLARMRDCDSVIYVMNAWTFPLWRDKTNYSRLVRSDIKNIAIAMTFWDQVLIDSPDRVKIKMDEINTGFQRYFKIPEERIFWLNNQRAIEAIEQNDTEAYSKTGYPKLESFLTDYYIKLRSGEKK